MVHKSFRHDIYASRPPLREVCVVGLKSGGAAGFVSSRRGYHGN